MIGRRGFLGVLVGAIAAPTIARASSLMPIRAIPEPWLLPRGQWLRRADYPELFRIMGNMYGAGPGTFRLPTLPHGLRMMELPDTDIMVRALPHPSLPVGTLTYFKRPAMRDVTQWERA